MQKVKLPQFQLVEQLITKSPLSINLTDKSYTPLITKKPNTSKIKELEDRFDNICTELKKLSELEEKLKDYLSTAELIPPKDIAKHKKISDNIIIVKYRLIKLEERKDALNHELEQIITELETALSKELKIECNLLMPLLNGDFFNKIFTTFKKRISNFTSYRLQFKPLLPHLYGLISTCKNFKKPVRYNASFQKAKTLENKLPPLVGSECFTVTYYQDNKSNTRIRGPDDILGSLNYL